MGRSPGYPRSQEPGKPRIGRPGYSQPSLRDWSCWARTPNTHVLGYFQPSLRDSNLKQVLTLDPAQRGPYAQKVYGFSHISVTAQLMTLRHVDQNGNIVHAFPRTPEGKIAILS
jgi:hypothetical protein